MAKGSDNEFPSVLFDEQVSDPATPGTDLWRAYFKNDGIYTINDAGTVKGPLAESVGGEAHTWQDWTPAWTSTGTAPAIGNGTIDGRYMRVGDHVVAVFVIVFGSTTTFGSGTYQISLPVAADVSHGITGSGLGPILGDFAWRDNSPSQYYLGTGLVLTSSGSVAWAVVPGTGTPWGPTTPFTQASGDFVQGQMAYEAA